MTTKNYCPECNDPLPYSGICSPCNRQMIAEEEDDRMRMAEVEYAQDWEVGE